MLKKMMAQYVYDIVHLEGNPLTFLEVQTLLDGETPGGQRVDDVMQVLNQKRALEYLLQLCKRGMQAEDQALACAFHQRIAFEEALTWGEFRNGQVRISGADYMPPAASELSQYFADGLVQLQAISHPFEYALAWFFWASQQQFFFDGNKRTARALMNHILLRHGYYYLSVPAAKKDEFDQMMVDFYQSKNASAGMEWMSACYRTWD
ncbi:Fic family protein [Massilia sp. W12]|uniref:Fic family protein n=1 Tax=Massilia sp. W12 TaxID=3126507 RepID=UPI0030D35911